MNARQYREQRDKAQNEAARLKEVAYAAHDVVTATSPPIEPGDPLRSVPVDKLINLVNALLKAGHDVRVLDGVNRAAITHGPSTPGHPDYLGQP